MHDRTELLHAVTTVMMQSHAHNCPGAKSAG